MAKKVDKARKDSLISGRVDCSNKSEQACWAVDQLVITGGVSRVATLEQELQAMGACMKVLEESLEKASSFVMELSEYVSKLPLWRARCLQPGWSPISQEEFLAFKLAQTHSVAAI